MVGEPSVKQVEPSLIQVEPSLMQVEPSLIQVEPSLKEGIVPPSASILKSRALRAQTTAVRNP